MAFNFGWFDTLKYETSNQMYGSDDKLLRGHSGRRLTFCMCLVNLLTTHCMKQSGKASESSRTSVLPQYVFAYLLVLMHSIHYSPHNFSNQHNVVTGNETECIKTQPKVTCKMSISSCIVLMSCFPKMNN